MIWKSSRRAIAPTSARWLAMSCFARKTAETVSDFAGVVRNLVMDVRDCYRPELHYMRGPGPKWRAKHQPRLRFDPARSGADVSSDRSTATAIERGAAADLISQTITVSKRIDGDEK